MLGMIIKVIPVIVDPQIKFITVVLPTILIMDMKLLTLIHLQQIVSVCPIIYTKEGSEDETVHIIWSSVLCIAAPYVSLSGDNLGNSILLYWNGSKLHNGAFVEGDESDAVMEDRQHPC